MVTVLKTVLVARRAWVRIPPPPLTLSKVEGPVSMEQAWYFYIVRCRDKSLYSGITNDLERRLKEHNKGTGAKYTSGRRPVELVYSEKHSNVSIARKREAQVKSWIKIQKEQLIVGFPKLRSE